jgi:hypothetical protein
MYIFIHTLIYLFFPLPLLLPRINDAFYTAQHLHQIIEMYLYIHIYVYVHIYILCIIYIYKHIHIYIYIYICIYVHT